MADSTFITLDADATRALGAALGRALRPGTLVLLAGPLGVGKTTLAQGIAHGLGVTGQVVSPTYVLVREYAGPNGRRFVHMDFYRLSGGAEALDLGLEDYWTSGDIVAVEWPERAPSALPDEALFVDLEYDGECRCIRLTARGAAAQASLADLVANEAAQLR